MHQQVESGLEQAHGMMDAAVEFRRLRNAQERIEEMASQIPPLSDAQLHDLGPCRRSPQAPGC